MIELLNVLQARSKEDELASNPLNDDITLTSDTFKGATNNISESKLNTESPLPEMQLLGLVHCGKNLAGRAVQGVASTFKGGSASANMVQAGSAAAKIGKLAKFSIVINAVLLPVDILEFLRNKRALATGAVHDVSKKIRKLAVDLEKEKAEMKRNVHVVVKGLLRFCTVLNDMRHCPMGRGEAVLSKLSDVLQSILPRLGVYGLPVNHRRCQRGMLSEGFENPILILKADGLNDTFKQLAVWLWCSLYMGKSSVVVVINTQFTEDPMLWNYFGRSYNTCSGVGDASGVSVLLPKDFSGTALQSESGEGSFRSHFSQSAIQCHSFKTQIGDMELTLIAISGHRFYGSD